jgi:hypothetical protein
MKKYIWIIIISIIILIQLVPVKRDNPSINGEVQLAAEAKSIIQRSCYDCHSNLTKWPWYTYVAPVSWMITHDTHQARSRVNFTEWNSYPVDKQQLKLAECWQEIEEGAMPLKQYLLMHPKNKITDQEKEILKVNLNH